MFKQHKHCMYNVTLGHVRTTIGEVEKQKVLRYIVCVCLYTWVSSMQCTRACHL
jgi:hypothetical protein